MPSMRQVRARIRVAKNRPHITKAMKSVAAARLTRAQDRVQSARPYAEQMRTVMGSLANAAGTSVAHPLLEQRASIKRIGILAVTADRGLCGSYATNILKKTAEVMRTCGPDGTAPSPEDIRGIVIGRKGQAYFRRRGIPVAAEFAINMTGTTFGEAADISRKAQAMYVSGEVDVVYLVYTKFLSALTQQPGVAAVPASLFSARTRTMLSACSVPACNEGPGRPEARGVTVTGVASGFSANRRRRHSPQRHSRRRRGGRGHWH